MDDDRHSITMTVNGAEMSGEAEGRRLLVDFLRHELRQTGTHVGCAQGVCGACTIIMDGRPVRSCLMFAVQARGARIDTIEGLANGADLSPLQQEFRNHHALQCGYCTPGMLMAATALLAENADPSEDEIRLYLAGNLCRCTGYAPIVRAVRAAAARAKAEQTPVF